MKDQNKTKTQLIAELEEMRQRVSDLERTETKWAQAQDALKKSQRYFRALLNQLHEDIIVIDREYIVRDVNHTFLSTTGHHRDQAVGKHCYEISHGYNQPCDQMGEDCKLKEVFKTGKPINCLHEHQRVDDSTAWVDLFLSPLTNPEGKFTQVIESARDITNLVEMQSALRESEYLLRRIIDTLPVFILVKDFDGNIVLANKEIAKFYGSTAEEIIGKNELEFVELAGASEEEIKAYLSDDRQVIETQRPKFIPLESFTGPDGAIRWLQTTKVPLSIGDNPKYVLVVAENITERVQATRKLETERANLNALVENTDDLVWSVDTEYSALTLNSRIQGLLKEKYSFEAKIGKNILDAFPAENSQFWKNQYDKGLTGKQFLIEHSTQIGEKVLTFEISFNPIYADDSTVIGVSCFGRDITERKQAEEELRKEKDTAQQYLDIAGVMLVAIDKTGKVVLINKKGCEILGYEEEEIIGKNWFKNFIPEWLRKDLIPISKQLLAGDVEVAEYYENPILAKSGKERMIAWHNTIIKDGDGNIIGHLSSGEDITDQLRAEEEKRQMEAHLSQAQKLESIGTLASGVAHEINNPLMGIMNYAQLIHDRIDPGESRLREFSAGIIHETERVAEIVRNLLTFARHDKQSHSPARIDDILDRTLSLIRAVIKRDQIRLEVDVPDDLPKIQCRSQQIQQVLMNLLTNARDALNERYPEYDPNKICTVMVRPFEKDGRRWLRTTVEDRGAGIQVEIRERIFDPFYTTKDRATGTGLGLSISLGIVQDHHGKLTFESEENQFTRFYLDLPVDNGWDVG